MALLEVFLVLLEREVIIVEITALPQVAVPATDVASSVPFIAFLLIFEARLAVALALFAPNHLEHRLRLTGRNLAILVDHSLLEALIDSREQGSRTQVHEARHDLSEDRTLYLLNCPRNSGSSPRPKMALRPSHRSPSDLQIS